MIVEKRDAPGHSPHGQQTHRLSRGEETAVACTGAQHRRPLSEFPVSAMFCLECGIDKQQRCFDEETLVYQAGFLQCRVCLENGAPKPWVSGCRPCISCNILVHHNFFSHNQLKSGKGSTCVHCMGKATCFLCAQQLALERFSKTQLGKGFRHRRCKGCTTPPPAAPNAKAYKNKKQQAF